MRHSNSEPQPAASPMQPRGIMGQGRQSFVTLWRYFDPAQFDPLSLGHVKGEDALLHLGAELGAVDRWVQFKGAPEIRPLRFTKKEFSVWASSSRCPTIVSSWPSSVTSRPDLLTPGISAFRT